MFRPRQIRISWIELSCEDAAESEQPIKMLFGDVGSASCLGAVCSFMSPSLSLGLGRLVSKAEGHAMLTVLLLA